MNTNRTTPTATRLLRGGALLAALALAAAGCSSDDAADGTTTTAAAAGPTTTAPADAAACVADDWQSVDAGPVAFRVPADVEDQHVQGIDSLVGQYAGGDLTIQFDYGWYSGSFDELAVHGDLQNVTVDGFEARLVTADVAGVEGYEHRYLAGLFVPDVEGLDEGTPSALSLSIAYDDEASADTAACIAGSVTFG